jgi:DNA topoisomerase-1
MHVKMGKFGPFLTCSNYPECKNIINTHGETNVKQEDKLLGQNEKGVDIYLKKGPYGFYVELSDGSKKPKRASLSKDANPEIFTLEEALGLLIFPRIIGIHPEGGDVVAGIGPYGPYLLYDKKYHRLPSKEQAKDITIDEAIAFLSNVKTTTTTKKTVTKKSPAKKTTKK